MSSPLFSALDLPPELHELQNCYWNAEREWVELRSAYVAVAEDMLKRRCDEWAGVAAASETKGTE